MSIKKFSFFLLLSFFIFFTQHNLISNSSGSVGGKTGSPGDNFVNCTQCHAGTLNSGMGTVNITTDIPSTGYIPGQVYNVTATLNSNSMLMIVSRFGFEVTAENNGDDSKVGSFIITNSETQTTNQGASVTHTSSGNIAPTSIKSWDMQWEAPSAGTGDVTFYAAFNQSNQNSSTSGDDIYTTSLGVSEESSSPPSLITTGLPYDVNFDDPADDGLGAVGPTPTITLPSSGMWSIDVSDASLSATSDWFKVTGGEMQARDVDGDVEWSSAYIDISSVASATITMDVSETGTMEGSDYLRVSTVVDDDTTLVFEGTDDFTSDAVNTDVSGNTLQLLVNINNGAGTEYHQFDNVLVVETTGVDNIAPVLVSSEIIDEMTILAVSDEALAYATMDYNGNIFSGSLNAGLDSATFMLSTALVAGTHTFYFTLTDLAGNESTTTQDLLFNPPVPSIGNTTELLISEYGEGSSNNKYIEIYNGTGADVDLSLYEVWKIVNGGSWSEYSLSLSGNLADGDVYVIYNSSSDPFIATLGDITWSSASWNGDDAIGLVKDSVLIDVIGTDGLDPGSGWDVAGVSNATQNHTLVRKIDVCSPNSDWTSSAGDALSSEWDVYVEDDWTFLGSHTVNCVTPPDPCINANLSVVATTIDAVCYGEASGQANITMGGGTMPYTLEIWTLLPVFGWTPYVVLQTDTLLTVDLGGGWDPLGLLGVPNTLYSGPYAPAGDYYGVMIDANGCTVTSATETINQPTELTASTTSADVLCNGGTGSATVTTIGGTGTVSLDWGGADENALLAGTYTVTGIDDNGCLVAVDVTINEPDPVMITETTTDVSCYGYSDGSAQLDVLGGTAPYIYIFAPFNGTVITNGNIATGLSAGQVYYQVDDANGCVTLGSLPNILEPAPVTLTAWSTDESSFGANDGTAGASASGGTNTGTFLFSWMLDGVLIQGLTSSAIIGLEPGDYMVTATDDNGCSASETVTVLGALNTGCTPNANLTIGGIYPPIDAYTITQCNSSLIAFPVITPGTAYSTYVDFVVPTDTVIMYDVSGNGTPTEVTVTLDSMVVDAVLGLPNGISFTCNPPNCSFPGGTAACATIEGITNDPSGVYPLEVIVSAYGNFMNMIYDVQVDTIDDYVLVIPGSSSIATLNGNLTYQNSSYTPLSLVNVSAVDINGECVASTVTDINGDYNLAISPGDYTLDVSSDVAWGGVNSTDALAIQNHVIGVNTLSGLYKTAIDVNASSSNTSADALLVRQRFVNIIAEFDAGDWAFNPDSINVTTNSTEDFNGICMGDVNGSYIPPNLRTSSMEIKEEGIQYCSLNRVELPISVEKDVDLGAVSLVFKIPKGMIVNSVRMGSTEFDKDLLYGMINNELRISWMNTNGMRLLKDDQLLVLDVTFKNIENCNLIITNESELANVNAVIYHGITISYPKLIMDASFTNLQAYPNPFTDKITLSYTISEEEEVLIYLTDLLGNFIDVFKEGVKQAGKHNVILNIPDMEHGVYFITLKNRENKLKTIKVVK